MGLARCGNLLVARDPLASAVAADRVYSCAGERILSIIPAGPRPLQAVPHLWTSVLPRPKRLSVRTAYSGDRSRKLPVSAKTGLLEASATGKSVLVNVREPDASLKRPVPPVM